MENGGGNLPLLNLVEAGEERDGDEDDNGFLAVADLELWVIGTILALCASDLRNRSWGFVVLGGSCRTAPCF